MEETIFIELKFTFNFVKSLLQSFWILRIFEGYIEGFMHISE